MRFPRIRKPQISYDMLDLAWSASEAKRLERCEGIYHRGQSSAWNGKELLAELLEQQGGIHLADDKRLALQRIFAIIMWGELAAWKISAQLADRLQPLEAKMAASSQVHDEARHFYVIHDYLKTLGDVPTKLDRAPEALLELVLSTDELAHKLLGMQLMIEVVALTLFQRIREIAPEPVIAELMRYFERDEARHVGLGMQYLPLLMSEMSRSQIARMIAFQCRLFFWALWEVRVLTPDFEVLGIDPRDIVDRARRKQIAALEEAFAAVGLSFTRNRNPFLIALNGTVELAFPTSATRSRPRDRIGAAWRAMTSPLATVDLEELDVHSGHAIRTAHHSVAVGDRLSESARE